MGVMHGSSSRRVAWIAAAWGLLLAGTMPALAHNTWLVSSAYSSKQATSVRLAVVTTEHSPASEYRTSPDRVAEWVARHGEQESAVRKYRLEGSELVAEVHLDQPGVHVIAAALHPRFIEFEGSYFEQYLADEHAAEALEIRRNAGAGKPPGRMYYTKLLKTFIEIGDHTTTDYMTPAGHLLEIVPLSNPCRWRAGDQVMVRVLYDGKPAGNVRVSSGHDRMAKQTHRKSESHDYVESVFTGANGEATLTLECSGHWFFRTHLIRPIKGANQDSRGSPRADWDSFWASITFRVLDRPRDNSE